MGLMKVSLKNYIVILFRYSKDFQESKGQLPSIMGVRNSQITTRIILGFLFCLYKLLIVLVLYLVVKFRIGLIIVDISNSHSKCRMFE